MKRRFGLNQCMVLMVAMVCVAAGQPFITPQQLPWENILTGPPAAGSDQEKAEIATLLQWQARRTASDVLRCKSEEKANPFIFSDVLGDKFTSETLPITAALLKQVQADIKTFTTLAKDKWERKRPPYVDDRIHPCVVLEENGSYPSAHAVRGVVWSRILAAEFPDKKPQLLARGLLMGKDRVIAGIHFPSDVEAGQKLGDAIADKLLADASFKKSLDAAKAECDAAGVGK
jgi:acid phosphatase (class A)